MGMRMFGIGRAIQAFGGLDSDGPDTVLTVQILTVQILTWNRFIRLMHIQLHVCCMIVLFSSGKLFIVSGIDNFCAGNVQKQR